METDIPDRASLKKNTEKTLSSMEVDLACAYGWYLGMFQMYHKFKHLSDKEYEKIFDKLLKLYSDSVDKVKKIWDKK